MPRFLIRGHPRADDHTNVLKVILSFLVTNNPNSCNAMERNMSQNEISDCFANHGRKLKRRITKRGAESHILVESDAAHLTWRKF